MISRIDHVAVAVKEYEKAYSFFTTIFGAIPGSNSEDSRMKYLWQLFSMGDLSRIELLTPTGSGSFLDNFLENREGGFHHMTLQTPDIESARETLEKAGIPYFGSANYGNIWKELFIHPRDAFGILIQIAEFNPPDWLSQEVKLPDGKKYILKKNENGADMVFNHPGGGTVTIHLTTDEADALIEDLKNIL